MELWSKLRNLDAYPKVNEDFYSRTLSGGLITIISSLAILLLFFSEIRTYRHPSLSLSRHPRFRSLLISS
jgi:endoplasmic reticulum-Golgi intermediate compartment protein 3